MSLYQSLLIKFIFLLVQKFQLDVGFGQDMDILIFVIFYRVDLQDFAASFWENYLIYWFLNKIIILSEMNVWIFNFTLEKY